MILALNTSMPTCELALYNADGSKHSEKIWESGRQLAVQLPAAIEDLLKNATVSWSRIEGIILFKGPGSFTGLRIGSTVANTIAYAQAIPIVGTQEDIWITQGIKRLQAKENDTVVIPYYGSDAHITKPKK